MSPTMTPQDIDKFIELWRQEFGQELSREMAEEYAERLTSFVQLISQMGKPNTSP